MARISLTLLTFLALCCFLQVAHSSAVPRSPLALSAAKKSWGTSSTSSKFCKKFTKECYNVALKGKSGHVKVIQQCERHGSKHSRSYSFGCKSDNKDVTKKVLHNIGRGDLVTSTTTSVKTSSVTAKSPSTKTKTSTVTSFVATVPVVQISLAPNSQTATPSPTPRGKRSASDNVDKSKFCSAFSNGCKSRCSKINSAPKHTVCHSTSLHKYSLACQCDNGKMETQHALYDAAGTQRVETITTVSTTYKTVATVRPTHTTTATTIVKATASSTTQIVLAATGAVQVFSKREETAESSLGYVSFGLPFVVGPELEEAQELVAVLDEKTNLYQLQAPGDSNSFIVLSASDEDFTKKTAYAYALPFGGNSCGKASTSPGPADGEYDCESYVFGLKADLETLKDETTNVTMNWYNPMATSAKEYSWIIDSNNHLAAASDPKSANPNDGTATQVFLRYPIPVPESAPDSETLI